MCLVDEADGRGDIGERLSSQDPVARRVQAATDHIAVRWDPERAAERARELCRSRTHAQRGGGHGRWLEQVGIEVGAKHLREIVAITWPLIGSPIAERLPDALGYERESGLRLERIVPAAEQVVQGADLATKRISANIGPIDGGPDQPLRQEAGLEVEHSLAIPVRGARPAVVNDVRRQDADRGSIRTSGTTIEVVADRAVVDDEQRPRVVGVERIDVIGEARVEHLPKAGNGRLPGPDRGEPGGRFHRRIVQDRPGSTRYGPRVEQFITLIGFSVVSSVTPGPNNVLLWASGASFGFRRSIPHVLGTALGIGAMALGVAAGLGGLLTTVPEITMAMKVGGSLYLLYLA